MFEKVLPMFQKEFSVFSFGLIFKAGFKIILIIVVAYLTAKICQYLTAKFIKFIEKRSFESHERLSLRTRTLSTIFNGLIILSAIAFSLILILGVLGINIGALIAGASFAGLALSFGAQSLVKDVITGFFILLEDQFGIGDIVKIGNFSGTVEDMNLRTTILRDLSGSVHIIPNGEIKEVTVMTKSWARALVDITVHYNQDVHKILDVISRQTEALYKEMPDLILESPQVLGIDSIDINGVKIRVSIKTKPAEQWNIERALRQKIIEAFNKEGIEMPFIPLVKD